MTQYNEALQILKPVMTWFQQFPTLRSLKDAATKSEVDFLDPPNATMCYWLKNQLLSYKGIDYTCGWVQDPTATPGAVAVKSMLPEGDRELPVILLVVPPNTNDDDIIFKGVVPEAEHLVHEIIHFLDTDVAGVKHDMPKPSDDRHGYVNHPLELNARFQEGLFAFIQCKTLLDCTLDETEFVRTYHLEYWSQGYRAELDEAIRLKYDERICTFLTKWYIENLG